MPSSPERWLVPYRRSASARCRLLCFPHAGGQPLAFAAWAGALPPDVDVLAAALPGRGARLFEAPIDALEPLLDGLGPAVMAGMDQATVFLGHSMGAVVAFELCRWLAARGAPLPRLLVVAGHRAPHLPLKGAPVHAMPDAGVRGELARLGGTPAEVLASDEMMALLLPMIRADHRIAETWQRSRGVAVGCPILAMGGRSDPDVAPDGLEAWRHHTSDAFSCRIFDGGHFFVHEQRAEVAAALRPLLPSAEEGRP